MYWLGKRIDMLKIFWCDLNLTLAFYKKTRSQTKYLSQAKGTKDLACRNEMLTAIENWVEVKV